MSATNAASTSTAPAIAATLRGAEISEPPAA